MAGRPCCLIGCPVEGRGVANGRVVVETFAASTKQISSQDVTVAGQDSSLDDPIKVSPSDRLGVSLDARR